MVLVYLSLDAHQFTEFDAHYFPETAIRISRLSEPKNYSLTDAPGRTVLCAELPCALGGEEWAMSGGRWGMGAAVGDVDADGWPDLLVTQWGPLRLFRNREGKGFEEITDKAGLGAPGWSTSACFLDFDGDGVLDLAVADYLEFEIGVVPPPGGACSSGRAGLSVPGQRSTGTGCWRGA